ncbi:MULTISPECIES: VOC family protein [Microbacterium]|uniref:VOC family protein n=1 Tax=Microbacterium TaxID=33882 RepID=UPI00217D9FDD|nr:MULTISPECIES: VOC family protein [Microbacterium]UWF77991.1 VOC family protein [Microbacterium neungamense]WCM56169.1 VOC family protein [Microbacterium sp. EF45047]
MAAMTHLYSVIPASDLRVSVPWYRDLFQREPDDATGDEILWHITDSAWIALAEQRQAGGAQLTIAVDGFGVLLARLQRLGVEHEPVEQYGNGVRHVVLIDPDGNRIALAGM